MQVPVITRQNQGPAINLADFVKYVGTDETKLGHLCFFVFFRDDIFQKGQCVSIKLEMRLIFLTNDQWSDGHLSCTVKVCGCYQSSEHSSQSRRYTVNGISQPSR